MASRLKSTNCSKPAPVNLRNPTTPNHWSGQMLGRDRPPVRRAAPRHINCTALPFIGVCCKLLFTVRNVGSTDNRIPHPGQSPSASGNFVPPYKFSLLSISGGGRG